MQCRFSWIVEHPLSRPNPILFPFNKVRNSSVLEKQMKSVSSNVFSGTVIVWRTTAIPDKKKDVSQLDQMIGLPIFTPPDGGWKMEELLQRVLRHHHLGIIIITNIAAIIITIIIIPAITIIAIVGIHIINIVVITIITIAVNTIIIIIITSIVACLYRL